MNTTPSIQSSMRHARQKESGASRAFALAGLFVLFFIILLISLAAGPVLSLPEGPPVAHAAAACEASSPSSHLYTVTVCLTSPNATITGTQPISASITVVGSNPGVRRAIFYLDSEYLLTDYAAPYTFLLPTDRFIDAVHLLEVEMFMRDGFVTARTDLSLTFQNGVTQPPINTRVFTPAPGSTPAPGQPFVLVAVGDGGSGENNATLVTNLIASWNPNLFLYLGDVYEKGRMAEFYNWYGLPTTFFGHFRPITNPAIGNHEYENGSAPGYFDYWDNVPHYYSFNAAGWHFISLDTTSQFNQTDSASPQYVWLAQDLQANTAPCALVFFHHPVYSIGPQGDTTRLNNIWALLAQHGVDLVLTAHDHSYQRWYPLNAQGAGEIDPNGMTQFVVGTGGHGLQTFVRTDPRLAKGFDKIYGALRLELYADRADFRFSNTADVIQDSGSVPCVNPPTTPTPTATSTPTPTATATQPPEETFTFMPVADAYVNEASPDTNYGASTALRLDASPSLRSYLRFDVQGVSGSILRATLRLYTNSSSSVGYDVRRVTNNIWGELTVTYATAPAFESIAGASGSFGTGVWSTVDITSLVSGNGLLSLALTTSSTTAMSFTSREAGANAPQLIIETTLLSPLTLSSEKLMVSRAAWHSFFQAKIVQRRPEFLESRMTTNQRQN